MISGAADGHQDSKGRSIASAASRVRVDIAFAVLDVFVVVAAYSVGLGLRSLDSEVTDHARFWQALVFAMPVIVLVHLIANIISGSYGHVWEYASTSEALRVVTATSSATGVLLLLSWGIRNLVSGLVVPFSVIVIGGLLSLLAMGMVRFRSRLFSFHKAGNATRVLVVGTDREAVAFARAAPTLDGGRVVVGFLADHDRPTNGDRMLAGLEVLGSVEDIVDVITDFQVDEIVVVGGDPVRARRVVDLCLDVDVRLRLLPRAEDVMQDGVTAVDVRDINVEDILVRQPVETDLTLVRELVRGKRILVTGAGGSIGSEIVRQVIGFEPAAVWALDRDESLLHDAVLRWKGTADAPHVLLGDVRDPLRMMRIFEMVRPEIVFHAAALKHVPVLEANPEEAVLTNVIGTRNVIEAGSRVGMDRFVLISTDKAVEPSSVMGATKRVAELMTQAGGERGDRCIYSAVRFGNVLGSRGSVIPTFIEQVKSGGPVTVTDPQMTRYFMTVDEAVQLVLQASALAESSELFLLDMGEPVKIDDLARRLIRLAGLAPGKDVEIEYTGIRPGEKLREVLADQPLGPTAHDKIYDVRLSHPHAAALMNMINELEDAARSGKTHEVLEHLNAMTDGHLASLETTLDLTEETAVVAWS